MVVFLAHDELLDGQEVLRRQDVGLELGLDLVVDVGVEEVLFELELALDAGVFDLADLENTRAPFWI